MEKISDFLKDRIKTSIIKGICHGSRNGFEQNFFNEKKDGFEVIGTDISEPTPTRSGRRCRTAPRRQVTKYEAVGFVQHRHRSSRYIAKGLNWRKTKVWQIYI